eukprot:sb/3462942/
MSSRALRKLRGDSDLDRIAKTLVSNDQEKDDDVVVPQKSLNVFDLLQEGESDSGENDIAEPEIVQVAAPAAKRKKKKKKPKKKIAETSQNEDIDEILAELEIKSNQENKSLQQNLSEAHKSILLVRRKFLNSDNELRRLFGSDVTEDRGTVHQQFRRKSYIFSNPKSNWPPMKKCGIQMVVEKESGGITYFKYVHSKANYQGLQQMFWRASRLADPHAVQRVLQLHPYHIDTLLHLSEVCRISDDSQTAADLLNRAMFCLEKAFHPNFNVTSVSCQMDYRRAENRGLFVGLFRQILYASRKSCHQAAFELCKLLYNLQPEGDPLAMLLFIDTLALKTEDYSFVIGFVEQFEHGNSVRMLPNFAYSLALATFYKEVMENSGSHDKSTSLLEHAILFFPLIAHGLCDKCNITCATNGLFVSNETVHKSHTKSLTQQCKLYVERGSDLWRDSAVVAWFKTTLNKVNEGYLNYPEYIRSMEVRKSVFMRPPLNVMRHIFISDIPPVSALLPTDAFETTQDPHDPMPPPDSYADYKSEVERSRAQLDPITAFINSLLPGYNPDGAVEEEERGAPPRGLQLGRFLQPAAGDEGAVAEGGPGWRDNVRAIPGPFGDFLNAVITIPVIASERVVSYWVCHGYRAC